MSELQWVPPAVAEGERVVGAIHWRDVASDEWREGWVVLPTGATDAEALAVALAEPDVLRHYVRSKS